MRIVVASSEAVPYSKTGGLADVAAGLARALGEAGHDVTLIVPLHAAHWSEERLGRPRRLNVHVDVALGDRRITGTLFESRLPESRVRTILVDQPAYFARRGLYEGATGSRHDDNGERYVFFSRAVMEAVRLLGLQPDVIHVNDWQTALVPALLATEYRDRPGFEKTASVLTIHNLAFQGTFPADAFALTGLDWRYFNWMQAEFHGRLNLLKTGLVFADRVTTVSPTYAREIGTSLFGCGLDGVLRSLGDRLSGILNGVDVGAWNPATDSALPRTYAVDHVQPGKRACKAALQLELGLPEEPGTPLVGMISRMTEQKGFDLLREAAERIVALRVQVCFLGAGSAECEELVRNLVTRFPTRVAARIGFDEGLAHRIEAGCDAFLMPSRFEPCGLNQMYSQIYGTLPIVHRVGGLADTVVDLSPATLADGTATGLVFDQYSADDLVTAVSRAVDLYRDRPNWDRVVRTAMTRDFSWKRSAEEYVAVYRQACGSAR